jgi:hypothetical protein
MTARLRLATLAALLAAAAAFAQAAHAQLRSLPQNAARGEMRHVRDMIVQIGDRTVRLAPGAQIRDAANRIVLPAAVPPGSPVRYTLDRDGAIYRVWILSPQEIARERGAR